MIQFSSLENRIDTDHIQNHHSELRAQRRYSSGFGDAILGVVVGLSANNALHCDTVTPALSVIQSCAMRQNDRWMSPTKHTQKPSRIATVEYGTTSTLSVLS